MTFIIVVGFSGMVLSTIIFSAFDLYRHDYIRKLGALINLCVSLPSILCFTYFLWYFVKMGDEFVKTLSFQYDISELKYRLIIGGMTLTIVSGWSNSVMIYIYLPIKQLIFNQGCTLEFLQAA